MNDRHQRPDSKREPETKTQGSDDREQGSQRRIDLTVTKIKPGEAAHQIAAKPFPQYPQHRHDQDSARGGPAWPKTGLQKSDRHRVERHQRCEYQHRTSG